MEQEILDKADEMFRRYGLKPVTMDDLARELVISKKTLYKHFSSKEKLVERTVNAVFERVKKTLLAAREAEGNAIDQLFNIDERICRTVENYDHSLQFQMRRYYPEVFSSLERKRKKLIIETTRHNIRQGKKEGLYRQEVNDEIITLLYYSRMVMLTGEEIDPFRDFDIRMVMREILLYHLRGIATERGLLYLNQKLNEEHKNENAS